MVSKKILTRALWFMNQEIERVLGDLESGVISKDQAIGSLNTIFNIASGIENIRYMKTICAIIGYVRSNSNNYKIKKMYISNYFDQPPEDTMNKNTNKIKPLT